MKLVGIVREDCQHSSITTDWGKFLEIYILPIIKHKIWHNIERVKLDELS